MWDVEVFWCLEMKMLWDEIFIFLADLIMYVSTVKLKTAAPVRDVSSVPFCHWRRIHYLLITGDCLAYTHMQPYGNIKWRGCTPQWTHWISMSVSCLWLIMQMFGWLSFFDSFITSPNVLAKDFLSYMTTPVLFDLLFQIIPTVTQWINGLDYARMV